MLRFGGRSEEVAIREVSDAGRRPREPSSGKNCIACLLLGEEDVGGSRLWEDGEDGVDGVDGEDGEDGEMGVRSDLQFS